MITRSPISAAMDRRVAPTAPLRPMRTPGPMTALAPMTVPAPISAPGPITAPGSTTTPASSRADGMDMRGRRYAGLVEDRRRLHRRRIELRHDQGHGAIGLARDERRAAGRRGRRRTAARRAPPPRASRGRRRGISDCRERSGRPAPPDRARRRRRSRVRRRASSASAAPHQLATSASVGAELCGKKRILAKRCGFRQMRRRARQSRDAPAISGERTFEARTSRRPRN